MSRSLGSLTKEDLSICEHCLSGKVTRLPYDKSKSGSSPSQLIYFWGDTLLTTTYILNRVSHPPYMNYG